MKQKIPTYILYAIGEITLVVIGILIAVQIDSWNKSKETKKTINTYFVNLESELKVNKEILNDVIESNQKVIESGRALCDIIGFDSIDYDEIQFSELMSGSFEPNIIFQPNTSVLNELLNSGNIKNIENQELKKVLIDFSINLDRVRFKEEIIWADKDLCINDIRSHGSMRKILDISEASKYFLDIREGGKSKGNQKVKELSLFENNLLVFLASSISLQNGYKSLLEVLDHLTEIVKKEIRK